MRIRECRVATNRPLAVVLLLGTALLFSASGARGDVYWMDRNLHEPFAPSFVGHARLNGTEANGKFLYPNSYLGNGVAADGKYVYAALPGASGGTIGRAPLGGGTFESSFISGLKGVQGVAVDSRYVFWTNKEDRPAGAPYAIGRARIDGSEVQPELITFPESEKPLAIATQGEYIYWTSGSDSIGRANFNGGEVQHEFISGKAGGGGAPALGYGMEAIATDENHIYWRNFAEDPETKKVTSNVGRAGIGGSNVEKEWMPNVEEGFHPPLEGLAVDASHIYWSINTEASLTYAVARADISGGSEERGFIEGTGTIRGIALDHRLTVNSTADLPDEQTALQKGVCQAEASVCTLRAAIEVVDAAKSSALSSVQFDITGVGSGKLATIPLTRPLPEVTSPIEIEGASQPGAFEAADGYSGIPHKLGVIVDGSGLPEGSNGLKLAAGATGSIVEGLQLQSFSGDGVLLEAEGAQLADSVLYKDQVGAEIAANNDIVGSSSGREGDIFFQDGRTEGLLSYVKHAQHNEGVEAVDKALRGVGSGVLLVKPSSGASIKGDWIGVHGPGFEGADPLPADGIKAKSLEGEPIMPIGIAVLPSSGSPIRNVSISGTSGSTRDVLSAMMFGVIATPATTAVEGLTIEGATIGAAPDGTSSGYIGTVMGVLAGGHISGLKLKDNGFTGDDMGAALADASHATVEGNTFGHGGLAGSEELEKKGLGTIDGVGLVLAESEGVQVGGAEPATANSFEGDVIGLLLAGRELRRDTIEGNRVGNEEPKFTTFEKSNIDFVNDLGMLAVGNGCQGGRVSQSQEVSVVNNRLEGNLIDAFTACTTGFAYTGNTFENSALGLFDVASGGTQVGTPPATATNSSTTASAPCRPTTNFPPTTTTTRTSTRKTAPPSCASSLPARRPTPKSPTTD